LDGLKSSPYEGKKKHQAHSYDIHREIERESERVRERERERRRRGERKRVYQENRRKNTTEQCSTMEEGK